MSNYIRYDAAPYESREQSRERWRKVYTKTRVGKWLLTSIGCAVLLTVMAWWVWEGVRFWLPWAYAGFAWLYLAGGLTWSRIRRWRNYVSTMMYMEALEDGECQGPFTWEARNRWYKAHGSPWRLQPVTESMRVHESSED
jgi:hypothetical protein